jgi:hypothetical protein
MERTIPDGGKHTQPLFGCQENIAKSAEKELQTAM